VSAHAGVLRDDAGLATLAAALDAVPVTTGPLDLAAVETTALHTAAALLAAAARERTESRGGHRRTDIPGPRPEWTVRLVHRMGPDGVVTTRRMPVRTEELVPA
jgi:L-aspartate oxidase